MPPTKKLLTSSAREISHLTENQTGTVAYQSVTWRGREATESKRTKHFTVVDLVVNNKILATHPALNTLKVIPITAFPSKYIDINWYPELINRFHKHVYNRIASGQAKKYVYTEPNFKFLVNLAFSVDHNGQIHIKTATLTDETRDFMDKAMTEETKWDKKDIAATKKKHAQEKAELAAEQKRQEKARRAAAKLGQQKLKDERNRAG